MGCWCGHGPWHHWGYGPGYPPPWYEPAGYGPPGYERRRGRRPALARLDEEDLRDYLEDLEEEVARVRQDLERLSESRPREP